MHLQGFVRPGCTNLILDILFSDRRRLGALFDPGATEPWVVGNGLARRVLGGMGMSLRDGVTLQYGSTVRPCSESAALGSFAGVEGRRRATGPAKLMLSCSARRGLDTVRVRYIVHHFKINAMPSLDGTWS